MSTKYPGQIDGQGELPVSIDLVTPVKAEVVNNLRGAIIAIESELGSDPSREYGTVRARIDALEGKIGAGGLRTVLDEGTVVLNDVSELNFTGPAVTATVSTFPGRVDVTVTGAGGTSLFQVQETLPTANGQTVFTLSKIPQNSAAVEMFVNGLKQAYGSDYTAVASTVTYTGVPLITSDVVEFWYITNASSTIGQVQETIPISFNGQTSIILSSLPVDGIAVQMYVNGDKEDYGTDYTVTGSTVTWISGDFSLVTTDVVEFWYIISGVSGGGGSQTLAQTLVFGNVTGGKNISMTNGDSIVAPDGYLDLNVLTGGINPPLIRFKKNGTDFLTFNPSASVNMTLADNAGDFSILYKGGQPVLNTDGSTIWIYGQNGNGSGAGGNFYAIAGDSGATGNGGSIVLNAGTSINNFGGSVTIASGQGAIGGDVNILAGGGAGSNGGNIYIQGGYDPTNNSGNVALIGGSGGAGYGGGIFLSIGTGTTANGTFEIYGPGGVAQPQESLLVINPDYPTSYAESTQLGTLSPALFFQYITYGGGTSLIHQRTPNEGQGYPTIFAGQGGTFGGLIGLIGAFGSSGGGLVNIEGGQCLGSGNGGDVSIHSGTTVDGLSGNIFIQCPDSTGTNSGADIEVGAGASGTGATGNGGNVSLYAGSALSVDGYGGYINLTPGLGTGSGSNGLVQINGSFTYQRFIISPPALTANVNDWLPTNFDPANVIRIDSNAAWNITGLNTSTLNTRKTLIYIGTFSVTLKNQDVGSLAANRFLIAGGDLTLGPNEAADVEFDSITGAWRVV